MLEILRNRTFFLHRALAAPFFEPDGFAFSTSFAASLFYAFALPNKNVRSVTEKFRSRKKATVAASTIC